MMSSPAPTSGGSATAFTSSTAAAGAHADQHRQQRAQQPGAGLRHSHVTSRLAALSPTANATSGTATCATARNRCRSSECPRRLLPSSPSREVPFRTVRTRQGGRKRTRRRAPNRRSGRRLQRSMQIEAVAPGGPGVRERVQHPGPAAHPHEADARVGGPRRPGPATATPARPRAGGACTAARLVVSLKSPPSKSRSRRRARCTRPRSRRTSILSPQVAGRAYQPSSDSEWWRKY